MLPMTFSNSFLYEEVSVCSGPRVYDLNSANSTFPTSPAKQNKRKRNLPGNPEPNAEVIALSPKSLLESNRYVCEVCNKGFQRDQNLQLHRRGHNLPWKLNKRNSIDRKKVYVCPEPSCVHHNPSRALGDLTGIKKHFCRKHREKRLRCHKCSKMYAVESDFKAHSKICGTRETICDCGRLFSRKDKYESHRPFCDALAKEAGRVHTTPISPTNHFSQQNQPTPSPIFLFSSENQYPKLYNTSEDLRTEHHLQIPNPQHTATKPLPPPLPSIPKQQLSFLQQPKITQSTTNISGVTYVGAVSDPSCATQTMLVGDHFASSSMNQFDVNGYSKVGYEDSSGNGTSKEYERFYAEKLVAWQKTDRLTRDFLGLSRDGGADVGGNGNNKDFISFTKALYFGAYDRDHLMLRTPGFGVGDTWLGDY